MVSSRRTENPEMVVRVHPAPHQTSIFNMIEFVKRSILAGVFIGIAGFVYLSVGSFIGALLFALGLSCVVLYRLNLYTSKAGIWDLKYIHELMFMLILNSIGCFAAALIANFQSGNVGDTLFTIIEARRNASWLAIFVLSIGTGIIMEAAVQHSGRSPKPNWIPLILGVPTFILCGMPHCVADIFYYSLHSIIDFDGWWFLEPWSAAIAGNFIGCNVPRLFNL